MIRISAKIDGFRRAGMAHSKTATDHPDGTFSKEQLKLLQAEPNLVVEILGDELKQTGNKAPTAAEQIERIKAAATLDEVVAILGDDKRATVLAAAEARQVELAG